MTDGKEAGGGVGREEEEEEEEETGAPGVEMKGEKVRVAGVV